MTWGNKLSLTIAMALAILVVVIQIGQLFVAAFDPSTLAIYSYASWYN